MSSLPIRSNLLAAACLVLLTMPVAAVAASPDLKLVTPPGGQRGTTVELVLHGERLADAAELLCYQPGLTVTQLSATSEKEVRAVVQIAADAPLGEHCVRLRTATGISQLRTFHVGPYPSVDEVEPNSDFDNPQEIALGTTVTGRLTSEDVDHFVVDAVAGQRISVEVEAMRLGRAMLDVAVAILDERRFELAQNDDSTLLLQDSVAAIVAPADGRYIVRIREASYGGCEACVYRLHVGPHARPRGVQPPGGRLNTALEGTLTGDPHGPHPTTLPATATAGLHPIFAEDESGIAPAPVWWRVADLPIVSEAQQADEAPAPPLAFHGTIGTDGERDRLRFQMRNGQAYVVNVYARRLRSPLDAMIRIQREGGENAIDLDDTIGLDPRVQFTAAADGPGIIEIRDRLARGGAAFAYRAEVNLPEPTLRVALPLLNSRAPQYRQTLSVPAGNRNALLVRVTRENIGGVIQLELPDLPPGLEAVIPPIAPDTDQTPLLVQATTEAEPAGALCPLRARIDREGAPPVVGTLEQPVPLVVAAPNETVYYRTGADRLAVAATTAAPLRIHVEPPPVPLVRGGAMRLPIRVERAEGFDGPIEFRMLWNPPGFASAGTMKIDKGATSGAYLIQARGDAALATRPLCIVARADTGRGEVWVASNLFEVTVEEPFVSGGIQMAAVEQGAEVGVTVTLEQRRPFEGSGTLRLVNLPAKTATEPVQIDAGATQAVFTIKAEADAPPVTAKNLFCQLVIERDGAPITHLFGHGGTLRVDRPPPPEVAAKPPVPKPEPAEPQAKPPAPLSRLEQLRQKARAARENEE